MYMKSISTLFIVILLSFSCKMTSAQQSNPYMEMAGKKYADYSLDLSYQFQRSFYGDDTLKIQKNIDQIKEVFLKTGSKAWGLELKFVEYVLFDVKYRMVSMDYYEKRLNILFDILKEAKDSNVMYIELRMRYKIFEIYWNDIKNYELAFEQCAIQAERLETVSIDDVPEKALFYQQIANAYYYFNDYSKAIDYFQKIINEKDNAYTQSCKQSALNGLGLIYREGYNDLDRSDAYFRAILRAHYVNSFGREDNLDLWNGIAEGNIAYNLFLREEYDKAIPLFKSSIELMSKKGDYAYASGPAVHLATTYLKQGKITEAKRYIDLAIDYNKKMSRDGRLQLIDEALSKYYASIGNTKLSMAYMDSTLRAKEQYDKQYNAMLLHRLDQKEEVKQQQELQKEKEVRKHVQIRLFIISAGFIVILILLVLLLFFYRKNREAYRELVCKSQEWANVQSVLEQEYNISPDKCDLSIMEDINRLMQEEKIYQNNTLSIDSLATLLGHKKHHVSEAINHCANTNFHAFINEYRIKEAIRLLSDKTFSNDSLDEIAYSIGFNDRKNFYRVFKKITGLSPMAFKKNMII